MDPLEVFEIEVVGEVYGSNKYRQLILDILQDLGLVRAVGKLYVYVDIEIPLFTIFGLLRGRQPPLRVNDIGDIGKIEDGYQIKITDEAHMADLLKVIWENYGRDQVEQPERDLVVVESAKSPENLVVSDIEAEFRRDLIDALIRITPEGFRNRRSEVGEDTFFFIASDETLHPEWIAQAKENIRRMQNA